MTDNSSRSLITTRPAPSRRGAAVARDGEQGWALLGVILMLTILGIFLASSITPNTVMEVQRSKEDELYYRGNLIARAIARYYSADPRRLADPRPIDLTARPPYGILTELKKLSEGVTIGVRQFKFARASEIIDPMTSEEWEPVRFRDPRLMKVFNAYTVETGNMIPTNYWLLAGPQKSKGITLLDSSSSLGTDSKSGSKKTDQKLKQDPNDPDPDPDDVDDDDEDPFADMFKDNGPIIGVATKRKGDALRPLYGLKKYQEWVFIYIPLLNQINPNQPQNPQNPQNPNTTPKISP